MSGWETAAQTIIFGLLDGNISCGVYDDVPQLPEGMPSDDFPYCVIGDDSGEAWDTDDVTGAQVTVNVHYWSRYSGMKEVKGLMKEGFDLINRATPTPPSGFRLVDCLYEFSDVELDPDGRTRHGIQRYRLTLQEA